MIKFLLRISAFLGKEIAEVIRQPRLILTLILGPFLILLLFGLGYINEPRAVRTLFVVKPNTELANQIAEQAPSISPQLIYEGSVENENEALSRLNRNEVDMVVVAPVNAYETIRNDEQAVFTLYHNEIDPAQVGYVDYLGQIYVQEVNRRVLSSLAQESQQEATDVQEDITAARQHTGNMRRALAAGDTATARSEQQQYRTRVDAMALALGVSAGLLSGVDQNVDGSGEGGEGSEMQGILNDLQEDPTVNEDIPEGKTSYQEEISQLDETDAKLANLESKLTEFRRISPNVLVTPFRSETRTVAPIQIAPQDFFTPGVIILLVQHIAVTIASLSIVRERRSGAMEYFRVSPVSSGEAMIGKYISYLIFGAIIAGALALLLAFGLRTPMRGSWVDFSVVVFGVLFASLGLGFVISLLAQTESQAVQLAMIALLLSVFFSGFMLDLRYIHPLAQIVSWSLPSTYGVQLLQNIMLRGLGFNWLYIGGLFGIGVLLFVLSWLLMRMRMSHE